MASERGVRASINALGRLLQKYASRAGVMDAMHALSILEGLCGAPTLTELALARIRTRKGRARLREPIALGEMFDRRIALYGAAQTRSRDAMASARRALCARLGEKKPADAVTRSDIERTLATRRSPITRNSLLGRMKTAFRWAVREKLLEIDPTAEIAFAPTDWREPAFFPPGAVERIMREAEKTPGTREGAVGAQLALGFFAGVRTAEIARARWEDLDLEARVLRVPKPKGFSRGGKPRLVELEECAAAWLRKWREWAGNPDCGPIASEPWRLREWKARRIAPLGLSWGNGDVHNVMRHTYATMHVAAFRDAAATALNLGHGRGTEILEKHYRGLATKAIAETYWRIFPSPTPPPPPVRIPGRGHRTDLHPLE